jgi:hypothetical protein
MGVGEIEQSARNGAHDVGSADPCGAEHGDGGVVLIAYRGSAITWSAVGVGLSGCQVVASPSIVAR